MAYTPGVPFSGVRKMKRHKWIKLADVCGRVCEACGKVQRATERTIGGHVAYGWDPPAGVCPGSGRPRGRPRKPENTDQQIGLRIPADLLADVDARAAALKISRSDFVRIALQLTCRPGAPAAPPPDDAQTPAQTD